MEKQKIYCAHDALIKISDLKPHPMNPNNHNGCQIEMLAKIISEQGWRLPIKVSKRSGYIVSGHGRYEAAKMLELKEVPVDYQDYESEAMELADLVADNRIAEMSKMDQQQLAEILMMVDIGEIDTEMTGYTSEEVKLIIDGLEKQAEALELDDEECKEERTVIYTCPKCGFGFEV